jgi:hypothetical protein
MPAWCAPLIPAATVILAANGALGVRRIRERGVLVRLRFRVALRRWDGRIPE